MEGGESLNISNSSNDNSKKIGEQETTILNCKIWGPPTSSKIVVNQPNKVHSRKSQTQILIIPNPNKKKNFEEDDDYFAETDEFASNSNLNSKNIINKISSIPMKDNNINYIDQRTLENTNSNYCNLQTRFNKNFKSITDPDEYSLYKNQFSNSVHSFNSPLGCQNFQMAKIPSSKNIYNFQNNLDNFSAQSQSVLFNNQNRSNNLVNYNNVASSSFPVIMNNGSFHSRSTQNTSNLQQRRQIQIETEQDYDVEHEGNNFYNEQILFHTPKNNQNSGRILTNESTESFHSANRSSNQITPTKMTGINLNFQFEGINSNNNMYQNEEINLSNTPKKRGVTQRNNISNNDYTSKNISMNNIKNSNMDKNNMIYESKIINLNDVNKKYKFI